MNHIYHTQIPAKLILFGEWGVLKGYPALGVALEKFFECRLEESSKEGLQIESPEYIFHWIKKEEKAPDFLINTQEALNHIFQKPLHKLNKKKLILKRNWKLSEGLGSSSALFLALLSLDQKLFKNKTHFSKNDLYSFQQQLIHFQKGGSGFDLLIQACGGFLKTTLNEIDREKIELPKELLLIHTGHKMKTNEALKNREPNERILSEIGKSTENFFKHQNWEVCIHEHYELLKMLDVVPDFVSSLKDEWSEKGWITCLKTTGAGGGDTLMLWTKTKYQETLLKDIKQKGYWIESGKPTSQSAFHLDF